MGLLCPYRWTYARVARRCHASRSRWYGHGIGRADRTMRAVGGVLTRVEVEEEKEEAEDEAAAEAEAEAGILMAEKKREKKFG